MAQLQEQKDKEQGNTQSTLSLAININKKSDLHGFIMKLVQISPITSKAFKIPDSFNPHVCLIRITHVTDKDFAKLKKYLGSFVQSSMEQQEMAFTPTQSERYEVGKKRNHDKSPLVLRPSKKESELLKAFNQMLQAKLKMFNIVNETSYESGLETDTTLYTPHITLLVQPWLKKLASDDSKDDLSNEVLQSYKDYLIASMNQVIKSMKPEAQKLPVPNYKFK